VNVKAFLLPLIFLAVAAEVNAQLLIGPEAGVNYSWSTFGDKDMKSEYKVTPVPGFSAGAHVGLRVRKRFFLHASILYSTKGRIIEGKNSFLYSKMKLNYIDVPLIYTVDFKGRIGHNKEFKYNLGVGPTISYWLGGKGFLESSDTREFSPDEEIYYNIAFHKKKGPDNKENEMIIESFNRVQLGLNITASLIFEPVVHRHVMLTVRYEWGHSYLSRNANGLFNSVQYQEPLNTKNQGFRITLSYLFDTRTDQRKRGKSTYDKKRK
jgi:outer membrane protein with beta-barrel domain